ncbi:MAG: hypothetical protein LAT81_06215 [Oceanicaulis sp.]|nr:hypothetical protein [Oceanicaulis sp.]
MKAVVLALVFAVCAAPSVLAEEAACADNQMAGVNKLVAPVVSGDDRLAGYAFVTPRVCLTRGYSALDFREREHLLMDALVRAVQHRPFRVLPDGSVDRSDAEAAFREALARIYGPQQVSAIALQGDDIRLMRHRGGAP